ARGTRRRMERPVFAFAAATRYFLPALRGRNVPGADCGLTRVEGGLCEVATSPRYRQVARDEGETMEIIRHLSNEELADLIIQSDQQALQQILGCLPGWAQAAAERNDEFWQNQRIATWSRITSAERRPERRLRILAWALAAATIAVSGWLL